MNKDETYILVIQPDAPHATFRRKIEFRWYPSTKDIFKAIGELKRDIREKVDDQPVKLKHVVLQKLETVEANCVDLDHVNTLRFRSSTETKL